MKWDNAIQRAIVEEWTEGCQKAKGPRAKQILRRRLAEKYGLTVYYIQGIIERMAVQGMKRTGGGDVQ